MNPACVRACMLVILLGAFLVRNSMAGAYIFAGEANGVDLVTHPNTYTGSGGTVTVEICIDPGSPNAMAMAIPVQNNIQIFNQLQPKTGNLSLGGSNNVPSGQIDFESVSLHEIGHCLGLAHVNAASESGLTGASQNYTRATDGADNVFNISPGADGVIGSNDDARGDDVNLHWYRRSNNNPFSIAAVVDSSTYVRDLGPLQALGHSFAANADRNVAPQYGASNTEAVMQQGTFTDEAQRTLTHDDVATLRYAASGIDETAGTADDYNIALVYGGISSASSCDVSMSFTSTTGLAFCQTGGVFIGPGHARITTASIEFGQSFSWFFNTVSITDSDGDGLTDDYEINTLGTDPNDADTDNDGLADGADGSVTLAMLPGGIDVNGDGFVDGEQDYGTDPLSSDSDGDGVSDGDEVAVHGIDPTVSNLGDVAPRGNPNNMIDAGDLVVMSRLVTGILSPDPLESVLADVNQDTQLNLADLLLLQQAVLNGTTP